MYCSNCGARIDREDAAFCPNCGAPLNVADMGSARATEPTPLPVQPNGVPVPDSVGQGAKDAESPKKGRRRYKGLAVALVVVLAIAAVGGGLWWKADQDRKAAEQAAWDAAHAERTIQLTIVAPGYTSAATRIPLEITGTDLDGNSVDRTEYVGLDDPSLSLLQGDYEIRVVASPILEDGSLYSVPADSASVTVGDADETSVDETIEFATVDDPASVTDDQIAAAKAAAEADPNDDGRAETLAQAAVTWRDNAVAANKAAREAKRQQVAMDFTIAYETNAVSPSENYTSSDSVTLISDADWHASIDPYIGSTTGSFAHGLDPSDGAYPLRAHDPEILGSDGSTYYVQYIITDWGEQSGWETEYEYSSVLLVTLDDNDLVISAAYGQ